MPQAKAEIALQFSESCAAEAALQHSLFCSAEVIFTQSCAAISKKLHCNIEKAALQEGVAFLPLSCGFQAPVKQAVAKIQGDKNCFFSRKIVTRRPKNLLLLRDNEWWQIYREINQHPNLPWNILTHIVFFPCPETPHLQQTIKVPGLDLWTAWRPEI